ncbi:lipoprotein [Mycoplasma feriruminatoris]|uniref:lipoprotein n=1 Tax=Mycoplasma feriruminatoris TaxID=1179777 RepID=UPI00241C7C3F|nr:lipoprotein [Mycoplasma feriruminatoris]WFQ96048.1 lipoprotein [Mycoplasma feriruminatoris]
MKKNLTFLSFITVLSSSIVLVSCKTSNSNQNINKKIDENKKEERNSSPINEEKEKINPNEEELPKDEPDNKSANTREDKKEKTDSFASKLKKELEDHLNKKEKQSIMEFASKLFYRYLQKSNENNLLKDLLELENKISKLFDDDKYDEIKQELTVLFSEGFNKVTDSSEQLSKKIKGLLDKVTRGNKDSILEEIKDLFEKKVSKEFEEELKNKTNEINGLLSKEQYESVRNKLFDLIDEIANLEKTSIK